MPWQPDNIDSVHVDDTGTHLGTEVETTMKTLESTPELKQMKSQMKSWLALPLMLAMSTVLAGDPGSQAQESHPGMAEHTTESAGEQHRGCHQHDSPSAERHAGVQADEQQVTSDKDRRKTRPSNITRRPGPKRR